MFVPTIEEFYVSPPEFVTLPRYKESCITCDKRGVRTYPCECVVFIDPCRVVNTVTWYHADPDDEDGTMLSRLKAIDRAKNRNVTKNANRGLLDKVMTKKRARVAKETRDRHDKMCEELDLQEPSEEQSESTEPVTEEWQPMEPPEQVRHDALAMVAYGLSNIRTL